MRILTVGNMYPPHHAGGYEVMWQTAVRRARQLGHSVRVLTSDYRISDDIAEIDPDIHRTLRLYWDLHRYEFPQLGPVGRLRFELHNKRELQRQLEDFRPDVVSWWSMGCMSLSLIERVRRAGTPASLVVHDDWLIYGRRYDQWIRMWRGRRELLAPIAERVLGVPTGVDLANAGRFVFNSRYTLQTARDAGVIPQQAVVVPPGIESSVLDPSPPRPWRWQVLYIGRIDRQKGIDTAVHALSDLPPEATLEVWGTGDELYVKEIKDLVHQLGLDGRVRFHGWADQDQRMAAYVAADVVVFPVRWQEPFGLVPLEAMRVGRPVVSTARGGTAEFLREGENALVFEPDDPAGLAQAIARLAGDEDLRRQLLSGGQQTAAHYTLERFAEETVSEMVAAADSTPRSSAAEASVPAVS
jgi:glycogen(starch) synthase